MIRAGGLAIAALALSACIGPAGADAQRVDVGGDVFWVRINEPAVVVHNFATGVRNQPRLFQGAQTAIAQVSPCTLTDFRQEVGVNTYTGTLTC